MAESTHTATHCNPTLDLSRRNYTRLAQFVTSELGIKMGDAKASLVQSRLMRRVRELGLQSVDEYCEKLFSSNLIETERIHLFNAITTNKTDFFREPGHFQYLVEKSIPSMQDSGCLEPNQRLAVWSAACSSGQEPYTLAMVLSEYAAASPSFQFRILGTDISTKVLQLAKEGIYPKELAEPIPANLRRKYLLQTKSGDRSLIRIVPELRQVVSFNRLNFMDADYRVREMFHVIFCRNVLIYFDRPTQSAVLNKLCLNLRPGGFLFVGHSESLSGLDVPVVSLGASCFRKPD